MDTTPEILTINALTNCCFLLAPSKFKKMAMFTQAQCHSACMGYIRTAKQCHSACMGYIRTAKPLMCGFIMIYIYIYIAKSLRSISVILHFRILRRKLLFIAFQFCCACSFFVCLPLLLARFSSGGSRGGPGGARPPQNFSDEV